jgi:hypothetical protein
MAASGMTLLALQRRNDRLHRTMENRREDGPIVRVRVVDERERYGPRKRVDLPFSFPNVIVCAECLSVRIDQHVLCVTLDDSEELIS